ncbi:hypothetical protein Hanom_Chr16g01440581 [Helianthus anomalus]
MRRVLHPRFRKIWGGGGKLHQWFQHSRFNEASLHTSTFIDVALSLLQHREKLHVLPSLMGELHCSHNVKSKVSFSYFSEIFFLRGDLCILGLFLILNICGLI